MKKLNNRKDKIQNTIRLFVYKKIFMSMFILIFICLLGLNPIDYYWAFKSSISLNIDDIYNINLNGHHSVYIVFWFLSTLFADIVIEYKNIENHWLFKHFK